MKKWKLAYSVLFFGVCLTPLVGMGLTKEEGFLGKPDSQRFSGPEDRGRAERKLALRRGRLLSGSFCLPE